MAEVGNLQIRLNMDTSNFEKSMQTVQNRINGLGKRLGSVGKSLTAGLTVPIVGVGVAAIKMSTDFNESMANVATLIPGNTERVNELKKSVQDMAIETGKSTDDLAGGLYNVISAFGDTADTATILEINAKAAAAGLATTTDAINLTSAVTKGYGDTSDTAVQHVSDLAFQAVRLGQTTFPELAQSMGSVTPLAASLGISMEEMFGVMATGTGVTGTASEVSTQFRGILQSLMAPTGDMAELFSDLGYESGQAMLEQEGLQGTINKIIQAAEESGKPLQKFIGSIEGQTLAMALAGPQADTFTEKLAAMDEVSGATDEAFREQTDGVNAAGFAWSQFQQKLAVTAQTLGDQLAPMLLVIIDNLQPLINAVMNAVQWFANLDSGTQTIIISILALVAAIGPLLIGLGFMAQAFATTLIPMATMIVRSAVVAARWVFVGTEAKRSAAQVVAAWASTAAAAVKNAAIQVSQSAVVVGRWALMGAQSLIHAAKMASAWVIAMGPIAWVSASIIGIAALVIANWETVRDTTKAIWGSVSKWLSDTWSSIKGTATSVWNNIKSTATTVWNGIKNAILNPIEAAKTRISSIIDTIKGFFNNLRLRIPKIEMPPLPHFNLTGGFSLDPPRVPRLSVDWYAQGGLFTNPSVIGVGEKGPEAVLPLNDKVFGKIADGIGQKVGYGDIIIKEMNVRSDNDIKLIARELYRLQNSRNRSLGVSQ